MSYTLHVHAATLTNHKTRNYSDLDWFQDLLPQHFRLQTALLKYQEHLQQYHPTLQESI